MEFEYFSNQEYKNAFVYFGDIRKKIANLVVSLCGLESMNVLDFLSGHGYLGLEISKLSPSFKVVGIGLPNDSQSHLNLREQLAQPELFSHIEYVCGDGSSLPFTPKSFDLVVNFLGLEDLRMTRAPAGVKNAIKVLSKLLAKDGFLQFSLVEYGDTPEEKLAKEIWEKIGLGCTFETAAYYKKIIGDFGLRLLNSMLFLFPKKMTSEQAKEELEFACNEAPKIFASFGIQSISFKELWQQFGNRIEEHGVAYWSRIRVLVFRKELEC